MRRYYVNISRDHVQRGVTGGLTQANHGRPTGLKQMKRGHVIVFYSRITVFEGGEPQQSWGAFPTRAVRDPRGRFLGDSKGDEGKSFAGRGLFSHCVR